MSQISHDLRHLRATAEAIAERARTDAAFRRDLAGDPLASLTAAGMPAATVADLLGDNRGEVVAYLPTETTTGGDECDCHDTSCWTSVCPGTCVLTI